MRRHVILTQHLLAVKEGTASIIFASPESLNSGWLDHIKEYSTRICTLNYDELQSLSDWYEHCWF